MSEPALDCLVVGAGAAGCTAAVYLRRFNRSVKLIDAGESRLEWIPLAHNVPAYPNGIPGPTLIRNLRAQVEKYGVQVQSGKVEAVFGESLSFTAVTAVGEVAARSVLIATGVDVAKPNIEGLHEAIQRGVVRFCPICDGFEARGLELAIVGRHPSAIEEAHFLRTYSSNVTYLPENLSAIPGAREIQRAIADGIDVRRSPVASCILDGKSVLVTLEDGSADWFDVLYPSLGSSANSHLVSGLGVQCDPDGAIIVDGHCRTTVLGVYAAGDVIQGIDQVATAFGNAAVAATAIHNDLREQANVLDFRDSGALHRSRRTAAPSS